MSRRLSIPGTGRRRIWYWDAGKRGRLLLSLDALNHVDDYSGTLGSVRKNKTKKSLNCHTVSCKVPSKNNNNKQTKKLVDWSVEGEWPKSVNSRRLYRAASFEREFQSLMVSAGKKESPLYCVVVVMRLRCWQWVRRWCCGGDEAMVLTVGAALVLWWWWGYGVDSGCGAGVVVVMRLRCWPWVRRWCCGGDEAKARS